MRKQILLVISFALTNFIANSQDYSKQFKVLQEQKDTSGQIILLKKWEASNPKDPEMFIAYFNYYVNISMKEVVSIDDKQADNSFQITDSTGKQVGFLNSTLKYKSDILQKGFDYIEKGISLYPARLDMRFGKIYMLGQAENYIEFTKYLVETIDYSNSIQNAWIWKEGKPLEDAKDFFLGTNSRGNYYVAQLNKTSNTWVELGGTNTLPVYFGPITSICTNKSGNVYAGDYNWNGSGNIVVQWNKTSNTWTELGGPNAFKPDSAINSICTDSSGNVYAAGWFTNSSGKKYVAQWNKVNNSWRELGGTNALNANDTIRSICTDSIGNVYAGGCFTNSSGNEYVAQWNKTSDTWSELGGTNSLRELKAGIYNGVNSICTDASGNVYVGCSCLIGNGYQFYVAQWNAASNTWSELGGTNTFQSPYSLTDAGMGILQSTGGYVYSICTDISGNVYAGGNFLNSTGNYYVAQWNKTSNTWSEVGGVNSLNVNGCINSICTDTSSNVYAGGAFWNNSVYYYVAKYSKSLYQ